MAAGFGHRVIIQAYKNTGTINVTKNMDQEEKYLILRQTLSFS